MNWIGKAPPSDLLRGFGLSLLVPEACYRQVAEWVDRNRLKGRLVYFHVRQGRRELPDLHRDSLARKLAIKPDSPFYDWLEREIAHRFDVACCATQEQFRREVRAITLAGQIKDPTGRHEKDDRHLISDRSRYVLGWTNTAKIAALEAQSRLLEKRITEIGADIGKLQFTRKSLESRLEALNRLEEFTGFEELDWQTVASEIAQLIEELRRLESASDILQQLTRQLQEAEKQLKLIEADWESAKDRRSKTEQKLQDANALREQTEPLAADISRLREKLEAIRAEALGEHQLTVESCDNREQDMRGWLQNRIRQRRRQIKTSPRPHHPGDDEL